MNFIALQVFMIIVAAAILAFLYWQSYKDGQQARTEPGNDLLPAQKARVSRLLLRKKQVKGNKT